MKNSAVKAAIFLLLLYINLFSQDRHYWDQMPGSTSSLLGGTDIAGVRDYSALFFNPGAFGFVKSEGYNINFSAYGLKSFNFQNGGGENIEVSYTRLNLIPSTVAGPIPFVKDSVNRFGYIIMTKAFSALRTSARSETESDILPVRRDYQYIGNSQFQDVFDGPEQVIDQGLFNAYLNEVWVGIGWGRQLNSNFSVGVTLFGAYREQTKLRNHNAFAIDTSTNRTATTDFFLDVDYWDVRLFPKLGLAADFGELKFGLTITSPSIHIIGSGIVGLRLSSNNVLVLTDSSTGAQLPVDFVASDRQESVSTNYRSPLSIALGMEVQLFRKTKLHLAGEWFQKQSPYIVIQPEERQFFRTDGSSEIEGNLRTENALAIYDAARSVVNFGLGIEQNFNSELTGYFAFRTDFHSSAFSRIEGWDLGFADFDIYHFTAGGSYLLSDTKLTIGVEYSLSRDSDFTQIYNYPTKPLNELSGVLINRNGISLAIYNDITIFVGATQNL